MDDFFYVLVKILAFLLGAIVGSFLNVVIHRLPRKKSIVRPASRCPKCGTFIEWYDNVPILSWLFLRGRCRRCGGSISIRYPLVELAAGIFAVLTVSVWGLTYAGLEALLFAWVSLALGVIDYKYHILPDPLTFPALMLGIILSFVGGITTPMDSAIGAVTGAAIPTFIIVAYKLLRGIEGMGWGDVKYLAAIGAVTGLEGCLWILIVGAVLGALAGIALLVTGRGGRKTELPFGTFLAAATILWLFAPPWLPITLFMAG